jgi:hypothetical protein
MVLIFAGLAVIDGRLLRLVRRPPRHESPRPRGGDATPPG